MVKGKCGLLWTHQATSQLATTSLNSFNWFTFPNMLSIKIIIINTTPCSGGKIIPSSQACFLNVINTDTGQGTEHIMLQRQFNSFITDWAQNVQTVPRLGLFSSSYQWCRVNCLINISAIIIIIHCICRFLLRQFFKNGIGLFCTHTLLLKGQGQENRMETLPVE
jgi:hypothetical protein